MLILVVLRKRIFSVCLLTVLALAGRASAATWTGAAPGDSWCTPENWDTNAVPAPNEIARINPPPEFGPIVDCDIEVGAIEGPKWSSDSNQVMDILGGTIVINGNWRFANGGKGTATVNIGGNPHITINGTWRACDTIADLAVINIFDGTISCAAFGIRDDGGGELNMSAGTLDVAGDFSLFARGGKPIACNMTGGSIYVGGTLKAPGHANGADKVTINLNGGTVRCAAFTHTDVPYSMNITDGTLIIAGDVRDQITTDVNAGYITAYAGAAVVAVEYDSLEQQTTVSAVSGVSFQAAASAGPETVTPAVITVILHNPPVGQTVRVDYAVTGGTATGGGVDYTLNPGTLIFPPGVTSRTIEIDIVDDGSGEADETVVVTLSNPVNINLGAITQHTYTILDMSPTVAFDAPTAEGREDFSPARIPVSLSWVWTETVTVDYNATGGTADPKEDYSLSYGTLVFEPGDVTRYINVTIVEDELDEDPDETVEITLSNPTGAKLGANTLHTFTIFPPAVWLCPDGDLDGDCDVDFDDLRTFGQQWLDPPGGCSGFDCADLDGLNGVDMSDFALLAGNWEEEAWPLVINEFMASNASTIADPQGDFDDWMEIYNGSPIDINVGGMWLADSSNWWQAGRLPGDLGRF
ncbi:MAG: Calx-beta domain-containing protein [Planctomycetota bacterium]|jgi:formylmethanofuran dehydrogenase subunit C